MKVFLLAVGLFLTHASIAQPMITTDVTPYIEYTIKNASGERIVKRDTVEFINPGDEVVFVNTVRNEGTSIGHDIVISSEVPENTVLVAGSISQAGNMSVQVSSGGTVWNPLRLAGSDLSTIRYVAWTINSLEANQIVELSFKIKTPEQFDAPEATATATIEATAIIEPSVTPSSAAISEANTNEAEAINNSEQSPTSDADSIITPTLSPEEQLIEAIKQEIREEQEAAN